MLLFRVLPARFILLLASFITLLLIGACGLRPLYQKDNMELIKDKVAIYINGNNDSLIREFRGMMSPINSANTSSTPFYRLEATVNQGESNFAVSRFSYSTRRKITVSVYYVIYNNQNNNILDQGSFVDTSSFDLSQTADFSNDIGNQYAARNCLKLLSRQLSSKVAAVILSDINTSGKDANKKE